MAANFANNPTQFTYEKVVDASEHLKSQLKGFRPRIGIVCGSGLGKLIDILETRGLPVVAYNELPNFDHLASTVLGHSGKFHFGFVHNVEVMIAEGRIHPYEGYTYQECSLPILLMRKLGVTHVILTNAAGSMNPTMKVGSFVLIKDHVDISALCGLNPLYGVRDPRFWSNEFGPGCRFVNSANCYDAQLRAQTKEVAFDLLKWGKEEVGEGIYTRCAGPYYESTAEVEFIKKACAGDVIGMSTTYEAAMAAQCSMKVLGITCVTDSLDSIETLTHEQVLEMGKKTSGNLAILLSKLIETHFIPEKIERPEEEEGEQ